MHLEMIYHSHRTNRRESRRNLVGSSVTLPSRTASNYFGQYTRNNYINATVADGNIFFRRRADDRMGELSLEYGKEVALA